MKSNKLKAIVTAVAVSLSASLLSMESRASAASEAARIAWRTEARAAEAARVAQAAAAADALRAARAAEATRAAERGRQMVADIQRQASANAQRERMARQIHADVQAAKRQAGYSPTFKRGFNDAANPELVYLRQKPHLPSTAYVGRSRDDVTIQNRWNTHDRAYAKASDMAGYKHDFQIVGGAPAQFVRVAEESGIRTAKETFRVVENKRVEMNGKDFLAAIGKSL